MLHLLDVLGLRCYGCHSSCSCWHRRCTCSVHFNCVTTKEGTAVRRCYSRCACSTHLNCIAAKLHDRAYVRSCIYSMHFNCTVNQLQVLHLRDALELPYYDIHVCTTITLELHLYDALKLRCYLVLPSIKLLTFRCIYSMHFDHKPLHSRNVASTRCTLTTL